MTAIKRLSEEADSRRKTEPFEPVEHRGSWLVLRTAPAFLPSLAVECEDAGARLWFPMTAQRRRAPGGKRRPVVVYEPVFPGYGFLPQTTVQVDGRCDAAQMRRLPHERYQFLRMAGEFVSLRWQQIEDLAQRQREDWCYIQPTERPADRFEVGDRVLIPGGLFGPAEVARKEGGRLWVTTREWGKLEVEVDPVVLQTLDSHA